MLHRQFRGRLDCLGLSFIASLKVVYRRAGPAVPLTHAALLSLAVQSYGKAGLLSCKEDKHSGDLIVTAVNRKCQLYTEYRWGRLPHEASQRGKVLRLVRAVHRVQVGAGRKVWSWRWAGVRRVWGVQIISGGQGQGCGRSHLHRCAKHTGRRDAMSGWVLSLHCRKGNTVSCCLTSHRPHPWWSFCGSRPSRTPGRTRPAPRRRARRRRKATGQQRAVGLGRRRRRPGAAAALLDQGPRRW